MIFQEARWLLLDNISTDSILIKFNIFVKFSIELWQIKEQMIFYNFFIMTSTYD